MPEVASEVAARLQAQGRFEEAEDCRLVTPLLAGPGDPNPLLSHSSLCARRQLARQALEHDRRQMSEMRVGEFVGRDGKDGNHCGVFSQIYYQIHSQSRQQERPEVSFLSPKQKWEELLPKIQQMKWRTAVYLLVMTQREIAAQDKDRQRWSVAQAKMRMQARERRVEEWVACDRRRATQPRPVLDLRNRHKFV